MIYTIIDFTEVVIEFVHVPMRIIDELMCKSLDYDIDVDIHPFLDELYELVWFSEVFSIHHGI